MLLACSWFRSSKKDLPERNVFFQAARSGRAGPPRSVFFHPDCTVGTGIAPVQLALADFLLTAGRGSHPALKTFYSVADSQYSTFFVKCNRFFRISAVVFGETIQSRCRRRRPRRPRREHPGFQSYVGRIRNRLRIRRGFAHAAGVPARKGQALSLQWGGYEFAGGGIDPSARAARGVGAPPPTGFVRMRRGWNRVFGGSCGFLFWSVPAVWAAQPVVTTAVLVAAS